MSNVSKEFEDSPLGNLPLKWEVQKVSDICFIGRGRVISQLELSRHPGTYPVYSSQSKDEGIFGYLDTFDFEGEYVTWTTDGAYAGSVFYRTDKFNCTNVCGTLKAKSDKLLVRYLAFTLSTRTKKHVSYVGNPKLMNNIMGDILIPLPPLYEQERIAEILDSIDLTIDRTTTLIQKLKLMKAGLLNDLLTYGLDENGELRDPIKHPEQFKDSLLGRIPTEWELQQLSDLSSVDRGKFTHRPRNDPSFYSGLYPFIQTGDISKSEGRSLKTYSQTLNERGIKVSKEFPVGTIAVTIAANIADTAILGIPMFFPDSVVGVIVQEPNNIRYVELAISHAKPKLDDCASQSAQKNINLEDLRPLLIAVPRPEEQHKIAEIYYAHDTRICTEEAYLNKLKN